MEFWTRNPKQPFWRQWTDAIQCLCGLGDTENGSLLLITDRPKCELGCLVATAGMVKKLAGDAISITVASPYPTWEWITRLKDCGIDHFWTVQRTNGLKRRRIDVSRGLETGPSLCPALHVQVDGQITLSVCGRHCDRMVLARHHLERWCLSHHTECPHWQGGADG